MIKKLIENNRLSSLIIGLLLVAGFGALHSLPRLEDPHVVNRFATVITHFPGASSKRVEVLVTEVLENNLKKLEEVQLITSISRPGISVISLELKGQVTETDNTWAKARNLIVDSQHFLPEAARNTRLDDQINYANTLILALTWQDSNKSNLDVLNRYAKDLENQLRLLAGTDFTSLSGEPTEEILVKLDAYQINQLGLSSQQIAIIIQQADSKISAGEMSNDHFKAQIELSGEIDSLTRIGQIPIKITTDGQIIRVDDIASINRQIKTPQDVIAMINGQLGIMISARMHEDTRVDLWLAQVNNLLADYQLTLPSNLKLEWLFEQNSYTSQRLSELVESLLIGFVLIILVLMVTLGIRSAFIVALSLPLTILFTLACMKLIGLPIHQMSITGLVVALGIMVDNAIVITDAINQKRQMGMSVYRAVKESVSHFWLPLAGSTLTTMLAFAPIAMMPGPTGEFVGGMAISVMFTLLGSYLISHTLIAGLAGRYNAKNTGKQGWLQTGIKLPKLNDYFKATLTYALMTPLKSALLIGIFPIFGFYAVSQMTEQFFPPSDRDMFYIEVYFPPQNSIDSSLKQIKHINHDLAKESDILRVDWVIGESFPSFYYNLVAKNQGMPNYAQAMVKVTDYVAANKLIPTLQNKLTKHHKNAQVIVRKLEQGPPFNAPIELRIYGTDFDTLSLIGDEVRALLSENSSVVQTRASLTFGAPTIWFDIDEVAALKSGLTLTNIATQIKMATMGLTGGSLLEQTDNIPIRIMLDQQFTDQQSKISQLNLISAKGTGIPLLAISEKKIKPSFDVITRRNGLRINQIEAYLKADVLPANVLQQIKPEISKLALPAGYRIEFGGENAKRDKAIGDLLSPILLLLSLLITILVLTFNSYRLTGIIILSAIQSAGLGLLVVYTYGYPFGFTTIVGLMGLMGLAINAAIVILVELKQNPDSNIDSVVTIVSRCSRHISSTTITTVVGFLPLIIAGGGFWPPFSLVIAGGTILTSMLSLIWVPVMYRLLIKVDENKRMASITF